NPSTLSGTVSNPAGGQIQVANKATLILNNAGTYSNGGIIALNGGANLTHLQINGAVRLGGCGGVKLVGTNAGNDVGAGTGTLTNVDNTIQGGGNVGKGTAGFANQVGGTVTATNSAAPLTVQASGTLSNSGTMQANLNTNLILLNDTITNTGTI